MDDKQIQCVTEALQELNTPDKISCISAAMVDTEPDNIIDLLNGLKETAKKIIQSEINTSKQTQEGYKKSLEAQASLQTRLMNAMEKL